MDRGRKLLLQYFRQLMNIGHTRVLFDHEVFNTELLLNYKEIMGTFCSTIVNPVSQSLKSILPELSSKLTNLHSDVNGHQKTSIYYLSSNFCQINDNVATMKNAVSRVKIFSSSGQAVNTN